MGTNTHNGFDDDEPIGESLLEPWGWFAGFAVVAVMSVAQIADGRDNSGEWPQSQSLKEAQKREQSIVRRDRAAQAMCSADYGPQVLAVWVNEDTVECVGPRGQRLNSFPAEAADASR